MSIAAIILAAGASRRLGQPKQLVCVAGETLLARAIRAARESGAATVLVVLGAHEERIKASVDMTGVVAVTNAGWEQGIATSIHAGVRALQRLQPQATAAMLLVCDQPRLTAAHLRLLIRAHAHANEPAIVASAYAGIIGIPAIFPPSLFPRLMALTGDQGARSLLRNPNCQLLTVPLPGGEVDIDTPADLES